MRSKTNGAIVSVPAYPEGLPLRCLPEGTRDRQLDLLFRIFWPTDGLRIAGSVGFVGFLVWLFCKLRAVNAALCTTSTREAEKPWSLPTDENARVRNSPGPFLVCEVRLRAPYSDSTGDRAGGFLNSSRHLRPFGGQYQSTHRRFLKLGTSLDASAIACLSFRAAKFRLKIFRPR